MKITLKNERGLPMWQTYKKISLIKRIMAGIVIGLILGLTLPQLSWIGLLGNIFITALKAIAPVLVFFIITAALTRHQKGSQTNMKSIIVLYLLATFVAALVAVVVSYLFPVSVIFPKGGAEVAAAAKAPKAIGDVVNSLVLGAVDNPLKALTEGNYLAILFWAVLLGMGLRNVGDSTKKVIIDISEAITSMVSAIIQMAPFGIIGLVYSSVASTGIKGMATYGKLIILLTGTMFFVNFVVYPFMTWLMVRQNPFPLTWFAFKESGIPAFFTRSSAVNIPINLDLCRRLQLDKSTYSISIPLGGSANSGGAAITISIMTLVAAHTLGLHIDFLTAFLLCLLTAISATGASGIAGGSLLLIPLSCSLFGISNDIAMQMVGIGFIIGVIQDSVETAVNSASDLVFTATAEFAHMRLIGQPVDINKRVQEAKKMA